VTACPVGKHCGLAGRRDKASITLVYPPATYMDVEVVAGRQHSVAVVAWLQRAEWLPYAVIRSAGVQIRQVDGRQQHVASSKQRKVSGKWTGRPREGCSTSDKHPKRSG
jgi:hypothetical protein